MVLTFMKALPPLADMRIPNRGGLSRIFFEVFEKLRQKSFKSL